MRVTDLAEAIPATWVPDLLGWPQEGREHLLRWGANTFYLGAPPKTAARLLCSGAMEMFQFRRARSPPNTSSLRALWAQE